MVVPSPAPSVAELLPVDWEEMTDAEGAVYFFNPVTNETSAGPDRPTEEQMRR